MTVFVESPWPAVMLMLVAEVVLAIFLLSSGRGFLIGIMIAVAAAGVGLVLMERLIVTEREEVEDSLDGIARTLVANDPAAMLALFSPNSPRRAEVRSILSHVTVNDAKIGRDLEIRLNKLTIPPSAVTYFTGRVDARDTRGTIPYEHVIRKFEVTLHRDEGHWLIFDYADADLADTGAPGRAR